MANEKELVKDEKKPVTDPDQLDYPRHLHKGEEHCEVNSAADAKEKIADGWTVLYTSSDELREKAAKAKHAEAHAAAAKK